MRWSARSSSSPPASRTVAGTARQRTAQCLKAFLHVPADVVSAVRSNQLVSDPKLEALIALTKEIVSQRGHVRAQVIENFPAAGYRKDQVLEVLIGVGLKTMSNYLDHIPPLDRAFQSEG